MKKGKKSPKSRKRYSGASGSKYHVKPRIFNSKVEPWKDYIGHFETCARANRWPKSDWGMFLGTTLQGNAYKAYASISLKNLKNWKKVVKQVATQLGDYRSFYKSKLHAHKFDFKSDLQDEALRICHEAQTAFPFQEEEIWQEAARSCFMHALPEEISS